MNTTTYEFMSYAPQNTSIRTGGHRRTATPERGWFAQDNALLKVLSTALVPFLGIASADANNSLAREVIPVTTQDAHAEALGRLLHELLTYRSLPYDWDSYDGQPANEHAMLDALKFLTHLPPGLQIPAPMLAGTGTVGLYWDRGNHYASLEFEGDGTYSFLTDSLEGYGGAERIPADTLPVKLWQFLAVLPTVR